MAFDVKAPVGLRQLPFADDSPYVLAHSPASSGVSGQPVPTSSTPALTRTVSGLELTSLTSFPGIRVHPPASATSPKADVSQFCLNYLSQDLFNSGPRASSSNVAICSTQLCSTQLTTAPWASNPVFASETTAAALAAVAGRSSGGSGSRPLFQDLSSYSSKLKRAYGSCEQLSLQANGSPPHGNVNPKNREAQRRFRQRQRETLAALEARVREQEQQLRALKREKRMVELHNEVLLKQLRAHEEAAASSTSQQQQHGEEEEQPYRPHLCCLCGSAVLESPHMAAQ